MNAEMVKAPILYKRQNQWKEAICGQCLHHHIGDKVDLQWNITQGTLKLTPSQIGQQPVYLHDRNLGIQIIKGAHFVHPDKCSLNKTIVTNTTKFTKPCTCVLLQDHKTNNILITQRAQKMRTYPQAWVLPGGHIQKNQTMFEGGIRQCEQEVGLPKSVYNLQEKDIYVFQTAFVHEGHVKASAIVVYFRVKCQQFQPKVNQLQVCNYKWKNIHDNSDEQPYNSTTRVGYPLGSLKYIQYIRQKYKS